MEGTSGLGPGGQEISQGQVEAQRPEKGVQEGHTGSSWENCEFWGGGLFQEIFLEL